LGEKVAEQAAGGQKAQARFSAGETTLGFIGLGDMGAAIASSIVRNGYDVRALDLRAEAVEKLVSQGARAAGSLVALADACDVAMLVVVDDKQVNQVVGEILRHPGKLKSIIVCSTVLPTTVIALAEAARAQGLDLVDAPVAGGAEKASRGTITVLIGGEDAAVQRCWPIFEAFGKNLFHIGPVGAGNVGKLVNNLLSLGGTMLQIEAMQLADAYGIGEDAVTEFIAVSGGDSRALRTWGRIDRARRTHTLAGTPAIYDIFSKDVKAAATAAGQRGVVLPIAAMIGASMAEKMKNRDAFLEARGMTGPIPPCRICGHELAAPFRKTGVHPECAYDPEGQSGR
jgi:3-hydroxyisobutyrate dehydrogenase-like beta-hydroxyacid dehydrogenase